MTQHPDERRWPLGRHGLTIVLITLFLVSWVGQFVAQLVEAGNDAREHGSSFAMSDFWPRFLSATFENWQSEFLQLFTFVLLTAYLIHRGSAESRDSDDEIKVALDRIERRLDAMDGGAAAPD
jgi:hypothetical protein